MPQQIWTVEAKQERTNFNNACGSGVASHGFEVQINDDMITLHQGKEIFAAIYTSDSSYKELGFLMKDQEFQGQQFQLIPLRRLILFQQQRNTWASLEKNYVLNGKHTSVDGFAKKNLPIQWLFPYM